MAITNLCGCRDFLRCFEESLNSSQKKYLEIQKSATVHPGQEYSYTPYMTESSRWYKNLNTQKIAETAQECLKVLQDDNCIPEKTWYHFVGTDFILPLSPYVYNINIPLELGKEHQELLSQKSFLSERIKHLTKLDTHLTKYAKRVENAVKNRWWYIVFGRLLRIFGFQVKQPASILKVSQSVKSILEQVKSKEKAIVEKEQKTKNLIEAKIAEKEALFEKSLAEEIIEIKENRKKIEDLRKRFEAELSTCKTVVKLKQLGEHIKFLIFLTFSDFEYRKYPDSPKTQTVNAEIDNLIEFRKKVYAEIDAKIALESAKYANAKPNEEEETEAAPPASNKMLTNLDRYEWEKIKSESGDNQVLNEFITLLLKVREGKKPEILFKLDKLPKTASEFRSLQRKLLLKIHPDKHSEHGWAAQEICKAFNDVVGYVYKNKYNIN